MNRCFKMLCILAIVGLVSASTAWAANQIWTGPGTEFGVGANWDPAGPINGNSLYINMTGAGSPVLSTADNGTYTVSDLLIGYVDTDLGTSGPGYFKQEAGVIKVVNALYIGSESVGDSTFDMTGGKIVSLSGNDIKIGFEGATGTLNMSANASIEKFGSQFFVGQNSTGGGTMTMEGVANVNLHGGGAFDIGNGGALGTVTMNQASVLRIDGSPLYVGDGSTGDNKLTLNDGAKVFVQRGEVKVGNAGGNGTIELNDSSVFITRNTMKIGGNDDNTDSTGTFNVNTGATLISTGWLNVGRGDATNTGYMNVSGTVIHNAGSGPIFIGANNGVGTWTQYDGITLDYDSTSMGEHGTGSGTLDLVGGVYATNSVHAGWGDSDNSGSDGGQQTINFEGGTLRALSNSDKFINPNGSTNFTVNLLSSGTIDSNAHNISVLVPIGGSGSLTKTGLGTLTLTQNNTYTGATTVNQGVLLLKGSSASSGIIVNAGGVLTSATSSTLPATTVNGGGALLVGSATAVSDMHLASATLADKSVIAVNTFSSNVPSFDSKLVLNAKPTVTGTNQAAVAVISDNISIFYAGTPLTRPVMQWPTVSGDNLVASGNLIPAVPTLGSNLYTLSYGAASGTTTISAQIQDLSAALPSYLDNVGASNDYRDSTNWTAGAQEGTSVVAYIKGSGGRSLTVGEPLTLGALVVKNFGTTLSGGTITLDTTTAANVQLSAQVDDYGTGGTSVIGNNLVLNKNLVVSTDGYYDGSSYVYSSLTINGNINDNDGRRDITKTGIGTLTLAGGEGWFITGNIDVQAGTLVAQGKNAIGRGHTDANFASRTVTVESGATLAFGASDIYDNAHRSIAVPDIIVNGGTLATINEGVHAAVNNVTLNNGTMTSTTDGWKDGLAWHLNGTLTSSGNSTINYTAGGGNISLQNGDVENPSTTFNVVDGTLSVDASLYNGLDNGGNYRATGLVKTGGGMLRLNRRNGEAHGFSGNIDIQGGTLMVGDYLGLGVNRYDAPGRTISVEAGATLAFARGDIYNGGHESTDMPDIFVNGGTISTAEGGAHIALNNITLNDGTMKSGTDGWVANWHLNGTVTSTGNSQMIIDSGANQAHRVMLKSSGTESERQTTFEVQSGMLTIEPMLTDGFDGGSFRTTGLVKTGNGTLNLNCDSWSNDIHFYNGDASTDRDDAGHAFSGNIDVQAGTLLVSGERALGLGRNNAPNRTVTVETGATLAFARGDVYGGHTTQDMPNLYVKGTLETLGSGTHVEVYSVTLDNGTMTSTTDGWDAYAWHFNGDITSKGASVINYLGGSGRITLHSGDDMTTPTTTFDVQDGSLTVTSPIIDGLAGNGSSRATGLKKIGEGLLDLTGSDLSYTGNTTVDAGRMDVDVLNTPNATVYVASGAELNASSIVADTLSIGGPVLGPVVVVPEPSTLVLLALAGLGAIVAAWRRK